MAHMWQPSVQAGEPDRLSGYEVYTSAYAPFAEAGKPALRSVTSLTTTSVIEALVPSRNSKNSSQAMI